MLFASSLFRIFVAVCFTLGVAAAQSPEIKLEDLKGVPVKAGLADKLPCTIKEPVLDGQLKITAYILECQRSFTDKTVNLVKVFATDIELIISKRKGKWSIFPIVLQTDQFALNKFVIPAKAGTHSSTIRSAAKWIPASVGMTLR